MVNLLKKLLTGDNCPILGFSQWFLYLDESKGWND
jgi:hypothetical protein